MAAKNVTPGGGACVLSMGGVRPTGPRSSSIPRLVSNREGTWNQGNEAGRARVGDSLPARQASLRGLGAWRLECVYLHAEFDQMQSACAALWAPAMRPALQPHSCGSGGSSSSSSATGPWLSTGAPRTQPGRRCGQLVVRAAGGREQQAGLNRMEAAVPREQRPVNELQQLKDTPLLAWVRGKAAPAAGQCCTPPLHHCCRCLPPTCTATVPLQATLELPAYAQRLGLLYGGVFLLLGGPIAAQTFEPLEQVGGVLPHQGKQPLGAYPRCLARRQRSCGGCPAPATAGA